MIMWSFSFFFTFYSVITYVFEFSLTPRSPSIQALSALDVCIFGMYYKFTSLL